MMNGPDELDRGLAGDLLELAEGLRRQRELLADDALHSSVDQDLAEAIRLLDQAAGKLLSEE
jgi:hypothetical protein